MFRPSILRLVLILRHDADARAPQHAGHVGIRAGFRGPLELVARRQVCGLDHVAGELLPESFPLLITGLAARLASLLVADRDYLLWLAASATGRWPGN
jgi:hypothetical protein